MATKYSRKTQNSLLYVALFWQQNCSLEKFLFHSTIADVIDAFVRKHEYAKLEIKDLVKKSDSIFCLPEVFCLFSKRTDLATQAKCFRANYIK